MTDKEVEKLLFDVLPTDEAARALRRLEDRKRFSDTAYKTSFRVYDMYDTGLGIPEISKLTGLSEGAIKGCIVQFGIDPVSIGYKAEYIVPYYREVESLDISDDEAKEIVDLAKSGTDEDFDKQHEILERIKSRFGKPTLAREADEKSEDYVSKGDWDNDKYSKRSWSSGYTETIDGYECDHCGEEFSSKGAAKIHVSMCDEKDVDRDDDSVDSFFNGDDGMI